MFAHNVPYQHSAIMINVVFPKPFTPQPLSHALPSPLNFEFMSPSFSKKPPFYSLISETIAILKFCFHAHKFLKHLANRRNLLLL